MKAVILAGGLGTRLSEETVVRPKPMVEIGGLPILWHIMKIYSHHGVREFIICLGYKGWMIKQFFADYRLRLSDVTVQLASGGIDFHQVDAEDWRVTLVETGSETMTGGRIKRARKYIGEEDFFLTYGDGLADIDISELLAFHRREARLVTVTAVNRINPFGRLTVEGSRVTGFEEKPVAGGSIINAGFFVVSPKAVDLVQSDLTVWEREPLERLTLDGELSAYHHVGFWHPLDSLRDRNHLEWLWSEGKAPWKVW
jgi:glucose-1-phosphate cytidylyltransferase